jgi:hypothetical protein
MDDGSLGSANSSTPENSSTGWPSFGEHFITPENSSTGWPSFGEHFNDPPDSQANWIRVGGNVTSKGNYPPRCSVFIKLGVGHKVRWPENKVPNGNNRMTALPLAQRGKCAMRKSLRAFLCIPPPRTALPERERM